jgi:hypothetical protein
MGRKIHERTIALAGGQSLTIEMPVPDDQCTSFVFGLHKCGSSMLTKLAIQLASAGGRPVLNIPGILFGQGIPRMRWEKDPALASLIRPGIIYTGFRGVPSFLSPLPTYETAPKLILVRDPRDALVSFYFSVAYSHTIPRQGEARQLITENRRVALQADINEWCIERARNDHVSTWDSTIDALSTDKEVRFLRYEDVIFDKARLVDALCEVMSCDVDAETRAKIARENDVRPRTEDPTKHVRRVTPGDHEEKLLPGTIEVLNELYGHHLERFGYL